MTALSNLMANPEFVLPILDLDGILGTLNSVLAGWLRQKLAS
jgi:hypothetical protein